MKTSVKGDLGVVKAIARLTEIGWNVGILITEHQHYDLLIEKEGRMLRAQVKYAPLRKNSIFVDLRTIFTGSQKYHVRNYNSGDYDVLIIYCPDLDKCFFIPASELIEIKTAVTLVLKETWRCKRIASSFEKI